MPEHNVIAHTAVLMLTTQITLCTHMSCAALYAALRKRHVYVVIRYDSQAALLLHDICINRKHIADFSMRPVILNGCHNETWCCALSKIHIQASGSTLKSRNRARTNPHSCKQNDASKVNESYGAYVECRYKRNEIIVHHLV